METMFQEVLQITEVIQIWLVLLSLQNRKAYWVETSGTPSSAVAGKGTAAALDEAGVSY